MPTPIRWPTPKVQAAAASPMRTCLKPWAKGFLPVMKAAQRADCEEAQGARDRAGGQACSAPEEQVRDHGKEGADREEPEGGDGRHPCGAAPLFLVDGELFAHEGVERALSASPDDARCRRPG